MLHNNYAVLFLTFCNIKVTLFITNKARKDFFYCSVFSLVCFLLHCMDGGENDESKKMVAAFLAMAAATALIAGCGGGDKKESSGGEKKFINIATGGTSGTYYPLGGALADILNKNVKGANASAQSTGASVANVNLLKEGKVDIGFIQNDISYYAVNGVEMFKDKAVKNLKGLATLYPETIQIVTTKRRASRHLLISRANASLLGLLAPGRKPTPVRSSKQPESPTMTSRSSTFPLGKPLLP